MKKLRLLVTKDCNRSCPGCCNKDWDLDALEKCTSFEEYDEIILTGGEPMLYPHALEYIIKSIRRENSKAKIFMYTAKVDNEDIYKILPMIDGLTLTIHNQSDVLDYKVTEEIINCCQDFYENKSFRLNIFKNIKLDKKPSFIWKVKDNIEWMKDCPLPKDEVFMRI